jgi:hypothetical protein
MMQASALYPFNDRYFDLVRNAKLALHAGVGRIAHHGVLDDQSEPAFRQMRRLSVPTEPEPEDQEFACSFVVPATGNCLLFMRWPGKCPVGRNFGQRLSVRGECQDGPFEFSCPEYYVRVTSEDDDLPGWAVAAPVNNPAVIAYGAPRSISTVTAIINNFDFERGNVDAALQKSKEQETLRVTASGRPIDFVWREDRMALRRLVDARIVATASLVMFTFDAWHDAAEEELVSFAHNDGSLCSLIVGQHTGIPVLSFFDSDGRPVKRMLGDSIESEFRPGCVLSAPNLADELGRFFNQCFEVHVRMRTTPLWNRLSSLCAAIEDPPYLEQKYATLMMAVEMLLRGSLIESGKMTSVEAGTKSLPTLVGAARSLLRWDIPRHFAEGDRYREIRNATDHGNTLPHDISEVRSEFDKWRLFLYRRILMRLGYDGRVV